MKKLDVLYFTDISCVMCTTFDFPKFPVYIYVTRKEPWEKYADVYGNFVEDVYVIVPNLDSKVNFLAFIQKPF